MYILLRKNEPDWRVKTIKELFSINDRQLTCSLEHDETQALLDLLTQER